MAAIEIMITANWLSTIWDSTDILSSVVTKANWGIAATLLLGCVFTAISIVAGNRKDELQKASDLTREEKVADAHELAAGANQRAGEANERAAKLEVEAENARLEQERIRKENLELQSQVEKERLARLQIEERLAPRSLSAKEQEELTIKARSIGPQRIDFFLYPNDVEILGVANQVARALQRAGWAVVMFQPMGGGNVSGMRVEYDPRDPTVTRRASAIASALASYRLIVQGPIPSLPTPQDQLPAYLGPSGAKVEATIRLTIGKK